MALSCQCTDPKARSMAGRDRSHPVSAFLAPTAGRSGCLSYFPNWRIREQNAMPPSSGGRSSWNVGSVRGKPLISRGETVVKRCLSFRLCSPLWVRGGRRLLLLGKKGIPSKQLKKSRCLLTRSPKEDKSCILVILSLLEKVVLLVRGEDLIVVLGDNRFKLIIQTQPSCHTG